MLRQLCILTLLLSPFASAAAPAAPAQVPAREILRLDGPQDQCRFGSALALLDDLDGDALAEVLAGAPGMRGVGRRSGAALILTGTGGSAEPMLRLDGDNAWSELGSAVLRLTDLDGDGAADFAVGARYDGADNDRSGSVVIVSGRDGRILRSFRGAAPRENLGAALCDLGDVDGDGAPEIALGAPGWTRDGARFGMIRIYALASGNLLREIPGREADGGTGSVLARAGDLDGDGRGDLLIGAPAAAGARGAVRAYSAATGELLWEVEGEQELSDFGAALLGLGDLDGDGTPDFAAGAPGHDSPLADAGRVTLHAGAGGHILHRFDGVQQGGHLGASLCGLGDLDGDGRGDVVAGEPGVDAVSFLGGAGAVLTRLRGPESGAKFGAALASTLPSGRTQTLAVGAPDASARVAQAGQVIVYTLSLAVAAPLAVADSPAGSPAEASAAIARPGPGFLAGKLPTRFESLAAEDGRWLLASTMPAAATREAAWLVERACARLDEVLGGPHASPATGEPVLLCYVSSMEDQQLIAELLAGDFPHLAEWAAQWGTTPQLILWNPLLSVIRHDESTARVKRPEMQVLHHAVHLELVRRYGAIPGWLAEALSYAIQDEIAGEIYAYSNRGWERLDDDYHRIWRERASDLWTGASAPALAALYGGRHEQFEQRQAYGRFGVGLWLLQDQDLRLPELLRGLVRLRPAGTLPEADFQPAAAAQDELFVAVYGSDAARQVTRFWSGVSLAGGPRARRAEVLAAVEAAVTEHRLAVHISRDGRVRLATDFAKSAAANLLRSAASVLGRLETVLEQPAAEDATPLTVFVLRDREAYRALCDRLAGVSPGIADYLRRSRDTTGFLLPDLPIAGYWDDIKFQEQTRPEQSVAHNAVHLWLRERYGVLPLWLSEGVACAVEEAEFRDVWANWNLDGFVYDSFRSSWRDTARNYITTPAASIRCYDWTGVPYGSEPPLVERPKPTLAQLYEYRATSFQDDLAHLAFAFAVYGLEEDPKGLRSFLAALEDEYQANWTTIGRFEPTAALIERLVAESFGRDFPTRFIAWWRK